MIIEFENSIKKIEFFKPSSRHQNCKCKSLTYNLESTKKKPLKKEETSSGVSSGDDEKTPKKTGSFFFFFLK